MKLLAAMTIALITAFFCVFLIATRPPVGEKIRFNEGLPPKSTLHPPATQDELARFRIVKSGDGIYANERFVDGEWILCPNRWTHTNFIRRDQEWWIENWRDQRAEALRIFKPISD